MKVDGPAAALAGAEGAAVAGLAVATADGRGDGLRADVAAADGTDEGAEAGPPEQAVMTIAATVKAAVRRMFNI